MMPGEASLAPTLRLLGEVFPGAPGADPDYLAWLYCDNPRGPVIEANADDELGRLGHYAVIPTTLRCAGATVPAALSLNTAVHERGRGQGLFVRLAEEALRDAERQGVACIVGVANANSTHGFVQRLGFTLAGPLPVQLMVPLPGARTVAIRDGLPEHGRLEWILEGTAGAGCSGAWNAESLQWRLRAPHARYVVHDGGDWLAVTTQTHQARVPVAVILAVLAARPLTAAESAALVRRVCARHHAPVALHAGINDAVVFRSVPLPGRLRPSPLNLIVRGLGSWRMTESRFSRFEFLDFDAY